MKKLRILLLISVILIIFLFIGYRLMHRPTDQHEQAQTTADSSDVQEEADSGSETPESATDYPDAQEEADSGPETSESATDYPDAQEETDNIPEPLDLDLIPDYKGSPAVEINDNKPSFTEEDFKTDSFEHYSELDKLGRCGTAFANVSPSTLPEEERGPIGEIHPSGWQIANYHDLIDGNYLYNRCHLIAYSLTGENANEKNLITGTRYLNTEGMQPYELEILEYVRNTGNHVLYRVTPVFEEENLVASGVVMEGMSVEDHGQAICFRVYAYNVQPGVIIDYKTGDNKLDPDYQPSTQEEARVIEDEEKGEDSTITRNTDAQTEEEEQSEEKADAESGQTKEDESEDSYVLNTNTHKFHRPSCDSVNDMKDKNKLISNDSREEIIRDGYKPCARCQP